MPNPLQHQRPLPPGHTSRPWWWDALSAFAFFGMAAVLGRFFGRLNFLAGFFAFAVLGGIGYVFAKSAWRALLDVRDPGRRGR
jgi:hypothetical protein